jgi:serine/threonine protein kinase
MPFYAAGDLVQFMQTIALGIHQIRQILRDILEALAPIHAKNQAHRDIKPKNIYIEIRGGIPRGVLGDFPELAFLVNSRSSDRRPIAPTAGFWPDLVETAQPVDNCAPGSRRLTRSDAGSMNFSLR